MTTTTAPDPLAAKPTRVGLIQADDNRFCGDSAFHGWLHRVHSPTDLVFAGLGVNGGSVDVDDPVVRERLRVVAVALTSPDARVWPLKLARILGSHGDAAAAHFGAQLVSTGRTMGPGTVTHAAHLLAELHGIASSHNNDNNDNNALAAAVDAARVRYAGRLPGFGVPFRPQDERLVGLRAVFAADVRLPGPHWRTCERVIDVVCAAGNVAPNVALGVAAVLLDCGVPPALCGLGLSLLMTQVFLAHAVEASVADADLRALPPRFVAYRGPARRPLPPR